MSVAPPQPEASRRLTDDWPVIETLQSGLLGLAIAALGIVPRLAPILLEALALAALAHELASGRPPWGPLRRVARLPLGTAGLCFLAFAGASAVWSRSPGLTLATVGQCAVMLVAAAYLWAVLDRQLAGLDAKRQRRFVRAIPLGAAAAVLFVLLEELTGHPILLAMWRAFPGLWAGDGKVIMDLPGQPLRMHGFVLNRNVATLVALAPAVLAALLLWVPAERRRWAAIAGLAAIALATLLSDSEAAKLAAVLGGAAFLLARRWPAPSLRWLYALLAAGVLLSLPLGQLPYAAGLHAMPGLPDSVKDRIVIWHNTALTARHSPVIGIGVQSTRYESAIGAAAEQVKASPQAQLGWHAHNAFLQTWLELGIVGAGLLLGLLLAAVGAIGRLEQELRPFGAALLVIVVVIAATGWGLWQPWLLGTFALGAVALGMLDGVQRLGLRAAADQGAQTAGSASDMISATNRSMERS